MMNDTNKVDLTHSALPWLMAADGVTVLSGEGRDKEVVATFNVRFEPCAVLHPDIQEANTALTVLAVNCHDELVAALAPFAALSIETCPKCEGSGFHPCHPKEACAGCGGIGRAVVGYPNPQDVDAARAALAKAKGDA
jgi:hypothetical protein